MAKEIKPLDKSLPQRRHIERLIDKGHSTAEIFEALTKAKYKTTKGTVQVEASRHKAKNWV